MLDAEELNRTKLLDRIATIVSDFEKHPGTNFRGLLNVLEILYRRCRAQTTQAFTLKETLLDTLLFFVFPYEKGFILLLSGRVERG